LRIRKNALLYDTKPEPTDFNIIRASENALDVKLISYENEVNFGNIYYKKMEDYFSFFP
jgi:hypothetical protein